MRPISLEIRGINSFKNETIINFDKLTKSGLFGIFGTTGSGKSTILDCIFLSLYGKVFRTKKPSEFINFNCKEGSVALEFSNLENNVRNSYRTERNFKRLERDNVEIEATLYELRDGYFDEKNSKNKAYFKKLLANTEETVNQCVEKIVGLGPDEFKKCIALPQGEFANFIKDPQKNKVATIGKIFNLEEYGKKFFEKLTAEISSEEKRREYIKGVLSQFDNLNEGEIDFNRRELSKLEEIVKVKNIDYSNKKSELLSVEKFSVIKKEKEQLNNKQKLFDQTEYEENKKKLEVLKASYKLAPAFLKSKLLAEEKNAILKKLEKLDKSIIALANESSLTVANQEQTKTKLLLEVANLEIRRNLLNKAQASEDRIEKLLAREKKLREELFTNDQKINLLKNVLDESEERYNKTSQILEKVRFNLKCIEIPTDILSEAKNYEKLKSERLIYEKREKELCDTLTEINDKRNQLIKKLTEDDIELNGFKTQLMLVEDSIANVLGKQFNKSSIQTKAIKEFLMFENAIAKDLEILGRTKILNIEKTEINEICNSSLMQVKSLAKKIDSLIASTKEIENRQLKVLTEKNKFYDENAVEVVKGCVELGQDCPICNSTISKAPRVNETISLGVYDFEYENLKHRMVEILDLRDRTVSEHGQNLAVYEVFKDKRTKVESDLEALFNDKIELEKQYQILKDKDETELQKLLNASHETGLSLETLLASYNEVNEGKNAKEKVCIKNSARLEELDRRNQMAKVDIEFNDNLIAELNIKALKLEALFEDIDLADLIKEIERKKAKEKEGKDNETAYLQELNNLLKVKQKNFLDYELAFLESKNIKNAISQIENEILENKEVITRAKIGDTVKKEVYRNSLLIDDKKAEINSLGNTEIRLMKEETKLKINKASLISESVLKEAEFDSAEEALNGQLKLAGLSRCEIVEVSSYDAIIELENKVVLFEQELLANTEKQNMLNKLMDVKLENSNVEKTKQELETIEKDYIEANKKAEWLKDRIVSQTKTLKDITYFQEECAKIETHLDNLGLLFDSVQGDKLLQFICEEYIIKITHAANEHLARITTGRYQLAYNEEYTIADNLYEGKTRSIGTLSGGETFLVSLAMAIAITEVLTDFKNKPLEFMFLDEGFGTLDNQSLETVLIALLHLKQSGLIIGLISHEELVKSRVPVKIEIIKANEKEGSSIK